MWHPADHRVVRSMWHPVDLRVVRSMWHLARHLRRDRRLPITLDRDRLVRSIAIFFRVSRSAVAVDALGVVAAAIEKINPNL